MITRCYLSIYCFCNIRTNANKYTYRLAGTKEELFFIYGWFSYKIRLIYFSDAHRKHSRCASECIRMRTGITTHAHRIAKVYG